MASLHTKNSARNVVFVMLNRGRGSKEVVISQIELLKKMGYGIILISPQPYEDLDISISKIDLDNKPIPIHDYLPGKEQTKAVYSMSVDEAHQYKTIFIQGIKKVISTKSLDKTNTVILVHHANIHTVAVHEIHKLTKIPYIVQIHGTDIEGYLKSGKIDKYKNGQPEGAIWAEVKKSVVDAQCIISISNFVKEQLIKPFIEPLQEIQVVYNQVPLKHLAKVNKRYVESLINKGKITNSPYILQIGELIEWKRPLDLVEASLSLPENIQVLFIGEGDPLIINKIITLGKNCIYLGPVYGANRNALISKAKILSISSLIEPFGLTLIEAGALGVPCVVRPSGALPEIIINNYNGFVAEDNSISSYCKALGHGLSSNPKLFKKSLSKYTISRFGMRNTTQKIVDLINIIFKGYH